MPLSHPPILWIEDNIMNTFLKVVTSKSNNKTINIFLIAEITRCAKMFLLTRFLLNLRT